MYGGFYCSELFLTDFVKYTSFHFFLPGFKPDQVRLIPEGHFSTNKIQKIPFGINACRTRGVNVPGPIGFCYLPALGRRPGSRNRHDVVGTGRTKGLLLQDVQLVAHPRCLFELQVSGVFDHLLFKPLDLA